MIRIRPRLDLASQAALFSQFIAARIEVARQLASAVYLDPATDAPIYGQLGRTIAKEKAPMCGIIGYVGYREAEPILVEGLRRLEYRGYDSAGLATLTGSRLHVRKRAGRIADLASHLRDRPVPGCHGISHTRWATHGPANDRNAHPHVGGKDLVAVVHN